MTNILNLLTPEQIASLEGVKADLAGREIVAAAYESEPDANPLAPEDVAELEAIEPIGTLATYVIDSATEPESFYVEVTTINGVEYDLRGEASAETECADCQHPIRVEIAPKGVDLALLVEKPRVAVCVPCGQRRVLGKRGTLVHDASGKVGPITTKMDDMPFDLSNFSNAQLAVAAGVVRDRMAAEATMRVKEGSKKAKKKRVKEAAENKASLKADRAEQGKYKKWMGEFTVAGKTVPALDFTEVGLDELVPPKMRSPYNKALHALGEPLLRPEEATYRVVRDLHRSLFHSDPSVPSAPEPKQQRLVADLEPDAKAKVEAFAQVTGKTHDEARKHLASINLI